MTTTRRFALAARTAVLAVAAGLAVAACNQGTPEAEPTQVAATPAPVETEEACKVPEVGSTVMTMDEIYCAEDAGLIAYRLDRGAFIIDPKAKTIPAEAQKAMTATLSTLIKDKVANENVELEAISTASSVAAELDRPVVIVFAVRSNGQTWFAGKPSSDDSAVRAELGRASVSTSHAATIKAVRSWIADQSDAAKWVIIDATL